MLSKRDIQISKALSYLLRHGAIKEKLNIDSNGFIPLNDILSHNRIKTHKATLEDVLRIVENNDKKRFTLKQQKENGESSNEGYVICANQGHSIESVSADETLVPLLDATDFPPVIIHGTYLNKLPLIYESGGLSKMNRNHIHFAYDNDPDKVVSGMRKSCNVLIYLDINKCIDQGIKFYRSANNVILSPGNDEGKIKPELFLKVVNRNGEMINWKTSQ